MPRTCSVYGCKSNYRSQGGEVVTTFSLPKNENLRQKWIQRIPTDLSKLKNPAICIKHFESSKVITVDKVIVNNELKEFERIVPKLTEDAVPTIFPNTPSYCSSTATSTKRLADVEREQFEEAIIHSLQSYKKFVDGKKLKNLHDVSSFFTANKHKFKKHWALFERDAQVTLCFIELENIPRILASIIMDENMKVKVIIQNVEIEMHRLPGNGNLLNTDAVEDIIFFTEKKLQDFDLAKNEKNIILQTISLLKSSGYEERQIQFLIEQLQLFLVPKNNRRYLNETMILASSLYVHSSAAYRIFYKSGLLCIPHPRTMQRLICSFPLFDTSIQGSVAYVKSKAAHLKPYEKVVSLLLDEVYIEPKLNFKAGSVIGSSELDAKKIAKTAQVFMISSLISDYKDVVGIVPVSCLTSEQLEKMILTVIKQIEEIGFQIIALISDNNNVNRRAFELLTPNRILQPAIQHPFSSDRSLFILFDSVHLIKCLRNNWIQKKDSDVTILVPDMENGTILKAQFGILRRLFNLERNSLAKFGHLLSLKALFPSSIQKQNVKLALNIFNDANIAALKCAFKFHPEILAGYEGTCKFIEYVVKWWKTILQLHEELFMLSINQLSILHKLSWIKLSKEIFLIEECSCKKNSVNVFQSMCHVACKIFLNNLVKTKNQSNEEARNNQKLKKFKK